LYGDFDVKNKMRHKHLFLSAPPRCDEQGIDSSLSLVAQVLSRERLWVLIPLVADGPSVSTISAFGNGGPTIPKHMMSGRGRKPRQDDTMRGGARFDWRRLIVSGIIRATSLYSADLNRSKP
jgi:hypothetical protein